MDSEQEMNAGVKVVCAVLLVAVVTAAGVGLLVQHRKLDEQRRTRASLENANQQLVASREELIAQARRAALDYLRPYAPPRRPALRWPLPLLILAGTALGFGLGAVIGI